MFKALANLVKWLRGEEAPIAPEPVVEPVKLEKPKKPRKKASGKKAVGK